MEYIYIGTRGLSSAAIEHLDTHKRRPLSHNTIVFFDMAPANKYAEAAVNFQGPGDARPTALQIIDDENMRGKLAGAVVLITGTAAGLGVETVRAMAATGATVFCAARDESKNRAALAGVDGKLEFLTLDLASFASVRAGAKEFLERSGGKLNILINNAGVMAVPEQRRTVDGFETQFAVNHLGHFLLFQLVKQALLDSSTPEFHSRVVNLSSGGHHITGIHAGNYNLDGQYNDWLAYGQSKTANIYMTNAIERKYGPKGLHGLAVHPGNIITSLQRHLQEDFVQMMRSDEKINRSFKSVEQGAATTVFAAVSKEYEGKGCVYLQDCGDWGLATKKDFGPTDQGYAKHAIDPEQEERLWTDSCKMVGIQEA